MGKRSSKGLWHFQPLLIFKFWLKFVFFYPLFIYFLFFCFLNLWSTSGVLWHCDWFVFSFIKFVKCVASSVKAQIRWRYLNCYVYMFVWWDNDKKYKDKWDGQWKFPQLLRLLYCFYMSPLQDSQQLVKCFSHLVKYKITATYPYYKFTTEITFIISWQDF